MEYYLSEPKHATVRAKSLTKDDLRSTITHSWTHFGP